MGKGICKDGAVAILAPYLAVAQALEPLSPTLRADVAIVEQRQAQGSKAAPPLPQIPAAFSAPFSRLLVIGWNRPVSHYGVLIDGPGSDRHRLDFSYGVVCCSSPNLLP